MKIAAFSDVHGNLPALQAVLAHIDGQRADLVVCMGDLAFKGPQPGECMQLIRSLGIPCVCGNTDLLLLHGSGSPAQLPYVQWHRKRMSAADQEFLAGLPPDFRADGVQFVHASPRGCEEAILPSMPAEEIAARLCGSRADWVVMGHTHQPAAFRHGSSMLVNVGAVGFSLDGNWRASYAVVDTGSGTVSLQRVEYDLEQVVRTAREVGFCLSPDWYGEALRKGWWEPIPWERRGDIDSDRGMQ